MKKYNMTKLDGHQVGKEYEDGVSIRELARRYDCSTSKISKILRRTPGVVIRLGKTAAITSPAARREALARLDDLLK